MVDPFRMHQWVHTGGDRWNLGVGGRIGDSVPAGWDHGSLSALDCSQWEISGWDLGDGGVVHGISPPIRPGDVGLAWVFNKKKSWTMRIRMRIPTGRRELPFLAKEACEELVCCLVPGVRIVYFGVGVYGRVQWDTGEDGNDTERRQVGWLYPGLSLGMEGSLCTEYSVLSLVNRWTVYGQCKRRIIHWSQYVVYGLRRCPHAACACRSRLVYWMHNLGISS